MLLLFYLLLMMAAEGGNIVRFIYTGEENIPDGSTHIFVDVAVITAEAFANHPRIVEVICHDRVEKIEEWAFWRCPKLRRIIMPGVIEVGAQAFSTCPVLTDVECGKLEIIKNNAFGGCGLSSISLPSARIVGRWAFNHCIDLTDVKFGSKLGRIEEGVFYQCAYLERITIPLKDGLIAEDSIFQVCHNLKHVDLIDGELNETIVALQFKQWGNYVRREIDSINQILPTTYAGYFIDDEHEGYGEKARVIRKWIRSVLGQIIFYQARHQQILNDAASTIRLVLPGDVVMNNVLSFLKLPPHTFELRNHE
jgi:hypothetical protein